MIIKRFLSIVLSLCIGLHGLALVAPAQAEETEIDTGVVRILSAGSEGAMEALSPKDTEILHIAPSGTLKMDGVPVENNLQNATIDEFMVGADNVEAPDLEEIAIAEDYIADDTLESEEEDDLDGGVFDEEPTASKDGAGISMAETTTDMLEMVSEDDSLDGAIAETKGYRLIIDTASALKSSEIEISWELKENVAYGELYAIYGIKAYSVFTTKSERVTISLPNVGKWRFCMIVYDQNNRCVYNGYTNNGGSLYVSIGIAPERYDMSYRLKDNTTYEFSVSAHQADSYTAVILKDDEEYYRESFDGTTEGFSFVPKQTGYYQVYLITKNNYGTYDGKKNGRILSFKCEVPGGYTWSASAQKIELGETVDFYVANIKNATSAQLVIKKDETVVARSDTFTSTPCTISYTPTESGQYSAYLIVMNEFGIFNGLLLWSFLNINVGNCTDYEIQGSLTDKVMDMAVDVQDAEYYYIVIERKNDENDEESYETVFKKKYMADIDNFLVEITQSGSLLMYLLIYQNSGLVNNGEKKYIITTTENTSSFKLLEDNLSFSDTKENLGYSKNNNGSLISYIALFGNAHAVLKYRNAMNVSWKGLSFGMAALAALGYEGYIPFKDIDENAKNMYAIQAPKDAESTTTTLLEQYNLVQQTPFVLMETRKNKGDLASLISAVKAFDEDSGRAVIITVGEKDQTRALLALSATEDDHGRSLVQVYDPQQPNAKEQFVVIHPQKTSFSYRNGQMDFDESISYVTSDIIFDAVSGKSLFASVEDSVALSEEIYLYIDADEYTIYNSAGQSVDLDHDAIRIEAADMHSCADGYILPKDTYEIDFKNNKMREATCSVTDNNDAMTTKAKVKDGTFYAGVESFANRIRSILQTDKYVTMTTECINAVGEIQKFEIKGQYLGLSISSRGKLQINTDADSMKQNGIFVDLSYTAPDFEEPELDGIRLMSTSTNIENNMDDLDGFIGAPGESFQMQITGHNIERTTGVLSGTIGIAVKNHTGEFVAATPYVAVYQNGKLLRVEKQSVILAATIGYFEVEISGIEMLSNDELTIEVFTWDEKMQPIANSISCRI